MSTGPAYAAPKNLPNAPKPVTSDSAVGRGERAKRSIQFAKLAHRWKTTVPRSGIIRKMTSHPDYQAIIKLGMDAVPLILRELERSPDHWFVALHEITKKPASFVPEEDQGNLRRMANVWISWGKREKII